MNKTPLRGHYRILFIIPPNRFVDYVFCRLFERMNKTYHSIVITDAFGACLFCSYFVGYRISSFKF